MVHLVGYIVLVVASILLVVAFKLLFSVPEERQRQDEESLRKKNEALNAIREAERARKDAEQSRLEAESVWSSRAKRIEENLRLESNARVEAAVRVREDKLERDKAELRQVLEKAKTSLPPHLAAFIADYEQLRYDTEYASSSYATVREYVRARRAVDRRRRQEAFLARYLCAYYEWLVPDLKSVSACADGIVPDTESSDASWLPDAEFSLLTESERAQLTLDRYVSGHKTNWQVGRDYELYVGFLYRKEGYSVQQFGIARRLQDMGRDLICKKDEETLIVQCKFLSQDSVVREKHIAQLFGSSVAYAVENGFATDCV